MKILQFDNFGQIVADTNNVPNGTQFGLSWTYEGKTYAETHRFNEHRGSEVREFVDGNDEFIEYDPRDWLDARHTKFIVIFH